MSYRVVIPSKRVESFQRTIVQFFLKHPGFELDRIIVIGGFDRSLVDARIRWINQKTPFNTSEAWNQAIASCPGDDVVILSDDVLVRSDFLYDRLATISREMGGIAVLMPAISGQDFKHRQLKPGHELRREYVEIPFICPYIPRRILDAVGPFDPRYVGYGMEDFDYCLRTVQAGYRIYVVAFLEAFHIPGESQWRKDLGGEGVEFWRQLCTNDDVFTAKWGSHLRKDFEHEARTVWATRTPPSTSTPSRTSIQ